MSPRRRNYTRASKVITRDASTGEVLGIDPSYDPAEHGLIVKGGNDISDASRRATKRREYVKPDIKRRRA